MKGIEHVTHSGARVLVVDYAGLRGSKLIERVTEASRTMRAEPEGSLLVLLRVRGLDLDPDASDFLITQLRDNGPYTQATALVGLGHLSDVLPVAIRLTGRDLKAFEEEEEALDWLASHTPPTFQPCEHVQWIAHRGESVLRIDLGRCKLEELERRVASAALAIRSSPPRSVLALNLVHGFTFDRITAEVMREYVRGNRPYILAAAVVGLDYMKPVLPALNRMTGRNLKAFDDAEAALDWLVDRRRTA